MFDCPLLWCPNMEIQKKITMEDDIIPLSISIPYSNPRHVRTIYSSHHMPHYEHDNMFSHVSVMFLGGDTNHLFLYGTDGKMYVFEKSGSFVRSFSFQRQGFNFDSISIDDNYIYSLAFHALFVGGKDGKRIEKIILTHQTNNLCCICSDHQYLFVGNQSRVQMLSKSGKMIREFYQTSVTSHIITAHITPHNIAVDENNVFVSDNRNHCIFVFCKSDGKLLYSIPIAQNIHYLCLFRNELFVSVEKFEIQVFLKSNGDFLRIFKHPKMKQPYHLYSDETNLFISNIVCRQKFYGYDVFVFQ